jgi:two-component system response regulator NreC
MIHALLADDHGIVRSGVRMLLDQQEGITVVAEAEDGVNRTSPCSTCRCRA